MLDEFAGGAFATKQAVSGGGGGSGDVSGPGGGAPSASTDMALVRWDGDTGTLIQNSGVILSDANHLLFGGANGTAIVDIAQATSVVPGVRVEGDATNAVAYSAFVFADAVSRFNILATGSLNWGGGAGATDVSLARSGTGSLTQVGTAFVLDSATSAVISVDRGADTQYALYTFRTAGSDKWTIGLENNSTDTFIIRDSVGGTTILSAAQSGNISANGNWVFENTITPLSDDGAALGTTSKEWSDLFLASGSVINWASSDLTLTHSSNLLTLAGGVLALPASGLSINSNVVNLAGAFSTSGANALVLTTTASTNVTLPTTGTLATLAGSETLSSKTLTAPKFADLGFIADANGNELLILDTVASAVNELTLANAATGNSPTLSATGGDSNIDLILAGKGTGGVLLNSSISVKTQAASPYTVTAAESGRVFTNEGATASVTFSLPTAAVGLTYTFIVQDADGIVVDSNTGDTIRLATGVSASSGNATSTAIGSTVTIVAINATEWIATSINGTWVVT